MKYCPKCKTQYDYDMSFCLEDGTALVTSDAPTHENSPKTDEAPPTMAQSPSSSAKSDDNGEKTMVLPADSLPQTVLRSENTVSQETVISPGAAISQPTVASNTNPNEQAKIWNNPPTNLPSSASSASNHSFAVAPSYDDEPPKSKTGILIGSIAAGLLLIGSAIGALLYFQSSPTTDIAGANTNLTQTNNALTRSNNTEQANFNTAGGTTNANVSQIFPGDSKAVNMSSPANQSTAKSTLPSPAPSAKTTPETKPSVEPENTPPPKTPALTPALRPEVPKTVSAGVLNGKATNLVRPPYPPAAKAVRASGAVNVQVTIDEDGNVISASAVSGHPLLKQAAENAARQSKFSPTTLSGQRVKVTGVIVYNFVAQ